MKQDIIETYIHQLDGMIATFQQATVIGGRTDRESQVCELLKDARLKLMEELEARSAGSMQDLSDAELETITGGASYSSSEISVSVDGNGNVVATNPGSQTPMSR
jgi:hypothetical protein